MFDKIACFVVLCMLVAPCLPNLTGRGPLGMCCAGIKGLLGAIKTPADRKTTCDWLKSAANSIKGINMGKAAGLPGVCRVSIPYKISPSTDCSKIR